MTETDILHGNLLKWKSWLKWSSKEFRLTSERLYYSPSNSQREVSYAVHSLRVRNARGNHFDILIGSTSILYLRAASGSEKTKWVSAIESLNGSIVHTGSVKKWANYIKGWQLRYFVLYKTRLSYFATDSPSQLKRGTIYLNGSCHIRLKWSSAKHGFDIVSSDGTIWCLKGSTAEEAKTWLDKIKSIMGPSCSDDTVNQVEEETSPGNNTNNTRTIETPEVVEENSDDDTKYKRDLDCLICLEVLVEPTTLACGHTFCRNCLSDMWGNNRSNFTCPSCRQRIESIPQINIALKNLIETLYIDEDAVTVAVQGQYREAFELYWANRRTTPTQTNIGGGLRSFNGNIMEFEFLKRGVWFVCVLWIAVKLISTILYSDGDSAAPSKQYELAPQNNTNILPTRSFTMFVLLGMLTCPRFLWLYLITVCYSTSFSDMVGILGKLYKQDPGLVLKAKVMFWGCLLPSLWGIPVFFQLEYYLICFISALITFVDAWTFSSEVHYLYFNRQQTSTIAGIMRIKFLNSSLSLLFCRFISFLPWHWVPDILYNCILLCVAAMFISRNIMRVNTLRQRSPYFHIF